MTQLCHIRRDSRFALEADVTSAHNPGTLSSTHRGARSGISLLEVLISMFVLLFGLMGVASIFPVGNHYAGRGEQFDRGSALAEASFADLKARGMLQIARVANGRYESQWLYPDGAPVIDPTTGLFARGVDSGLAFVIDPVGTGQNPIAATDYFPFNANGGAVPASWTLNPATTVWPLARVTLATNPTTATPYSLPYARNVFTLHDDVTNELPNAGDRPGIQRWNVDTNGNPLEQPWTHSLLSRHYGGGYSWIATVVPTSVERLAAMQPAQASVNNELYEVSVAVFNKREDIPSIESERLFQAAINQGGDLVLYATNDFAGSDALEAATKDLRAGQWIAVAGVHPTSNRFLLKWYRLLSIDNETLMNQTISPTVTGTYAVRRATLDRADWPMAGNATIEDLRAILLPGVISVSTQMLPMESAQ